MSNVLGWARGALVCFAAGGVGMAHAGWQPSLVQAASGRTFLQVVNDQGMAAGFVRTATAGRGGSVVYKDQAFVLDGQGQFRTVGATASAGSVTVSDINHSGQVLIGASLYSGGSLSALAGSPVALNDAGQIATTVAVGPFDAHVFHAALGAANGSFQDLGLLGGKLSQAKALNNAGQVVGFSQYAGSPGAYDTHAVLHDGHALIDLGLLLDPGATSYATAINNAGTVIGGVNTVQGSRGFVYRSGAMALLPLQGGVTGSTTADALNAAGQVLATSCEVNAACQLMLDDQGTISVLGRWANASTQGLALNDRGQVLASATFNGDLDYGLWDEGAWVNVDELVAGLGFTDVAYATLADGFLAGYGTLAGGQTQSFLLRDTGHAVPEPASLWLVLAALLAVPLVRRLGR